MQATTEMQVTDIRVNPMNHDKWNCEPDDRWNFKNCLDVHYDVARYFEQKLGSTRNDWGGEYASFLQNVGIDHESENGWWSKAAVNPENLNSFVAYNIENEDGDKMNGELIERYNAAAKLYKKLKEGGFKNTKFLIIQTAVSEINKLLT